MKTQTLYHGDVKLNLDGKHRYWNREVQIPSVTQCIDVIDKPALRFWFLNMGINYIENSLEAGIAYDEIQLKDIFKSAKYAHRKVTNEAADIGKLVHDWIESYVGGRIRGVKRNPKLPYHDAAKEAVKAFLDWDRAHKINYLFSERMMYSEELQVAGTVDIIAEIDNVFTIIDIKTSKAVYPEYHLQTAAYLHMAEEEGLNVHGDENIYAVDRLIIHVPKDGSGFSVHESPFSLDHDLEAFKACRTLYRWKEGK